MCVCVCGCEKYYKFIYCTNKKKQVLIVSYFTVPQMAKKFIIYKGAGRTKKHSEIKVFWFECQK